MSLKPYIPVPMLPGPVSVPDSILETMYRDYGTDDLDEAYLQLYKATGENLASLAGAHRALHNRMHAAGQYHQHSPGDMHC